MGEAGTQTGGVTKMKLSINHWTKEDKLFPYEETSYYKKYNMRIGKMEEKSFAVPADGSAGTKG